MARLQYILAFWRLPTVPGLCSNKHLPFVLSSAYKPYAIFTK
jgi:hypothetical protein